MESQSKSARFQFKGYRIIKSFIEINEAVNNEDFEIIFEPSGKVFNSSSIFQLYLGVEIKNLTKTINIEIKAVADFYFEQIEDDKLEAYLFVNAPALLFPYLRAYISTLSTLSGLKSVTLPTLNLIGLRSELKKKTEFLD